MKKVMVFGTFDIVHEGHIAMLREAKSFGDFLVVVVALDVTVEKVKGQRPLYTENERVRSIEQTGLADVVRLGNTIDKYAVIREEKPDILALGYDQDSFVEGLESLGIPIVRLQAFEPEKYKSSLLKKQSL